MGSTIELDVREIMPFERHSKIFDIWLTSSAWPFPLRSGR